MSCFLILNGRVRVFRLRWERFVSNCLLERDRLGAGSFIVYESIMGDRKTDRVVIHGNLNVHCYANDVLRPEPWLFNV